MGQNKLERFAELKAMPNALEYPVDMKGHWHRFFGNKNPITLELACGKGEYAVGLAKLFKDKNFLGVDLKGNRMWVGAKLALNDGLKNVGFLRSQIERIDEYFNTGEVAEIWITFPDPQLRISKAKKRLTHPRFLKLYQKIMGLQGIVNLKTDSPDLYNFTILVINLFQLPLLTNKEDLYSGKDLNSELLIRTHYENLDIAGSNRIHYLRFSLNNAITKDKEEQLKRILSEQINN
ncbi:MAG: tRNA (guanosine(46)-N7)-methyltransferase TrmB [Chitinophagaceae bacterium]|nr:tRNA (guanosine(46)-N7)-methyltransferase TrmB [Chitinophagaceae bacterium]